MYLQGIIRQAAYALREAYRKHEKKQDPMFEVTERLRSEGKLSEDDLQTMEQLIRKLNEKGR